MEKTSREIDFCDVSERGVADGGGKVATKKVKYTRENTLPSWIAGWGRECPWEGERTESGTGVPEHPSIPDPVFPGFSSNVHRKWGVREKFAINFVCVWDFSGGKDHERHFRGKTAKKPTVSHHTSDFLLQVFWTRVLSHSNSFGLRLNSVKDCSEVVSRLCLLFGVSKCGTLRADSFLMPNISCGIWPTQSFEMPTVSAISCTFNRWSPNTRSWIFLRYPPW